MRALRRTFLIVAATLTIALCCAIPAKSSETSDDVWLINTRRAPLCGDLDWGVERIDCSRLIDGVWLPSGFEDVPADDSQMPTAVYVHGNRTSNCAAVQEGLSLRRRIQQAAGDRPFRLVIWSWPSNQVSRRNRVDVRVKAARSDVQAYYLAAWLNRFRERTDQPVNLIGYSFGSRVIAGSLHLLGGGQLVGRSLPELSGEEEPARRAPLRAVLTAGAMDAGSFAAGCRNGLALTQVEQIMVTRNGRDPVLKWYPLMYGCGGPDAMGYVGPRFCFGCDNGYNKVEVLNVTCSVGKAHAWARYFCSMGVRERIAEFTFTEPADVESEAPGESSQE